ncbi:hypothetical protein TR75_06060 [Hydrogenibacillus schlegelii]|uniref:Uncharacterized protein n=1 Tax=Hydrogenibacillus schlegelii TaxID=1484 RepID=A0A132N894_HYDSH|nr:hypothetical protein TR75_06060 [Hydrogenibacillus schlegelii]OAR04491.1 hypothetical protein SA87_01865 [Hydrogenibacillus schlegelii]
MSLKFSELYAGKSVRGLILSKKLTDLNGHRVEMKGYMAPPLQPRLDFFVLTRVPLALCPFCSSDADWPEDIVVIYLPQGKTIEATEKPVRVVGKLDVGPYTDDKTGFVSLVRIYAERVEVIN